MCQRPKITAIVPTGNEQENIRACLESLTWADEILVVDSFSKDDTVKIASELAHKVLEHEYVNSAAQKNWTIPQAAHPWILLVDADERVTPELRDEIQTLLESGPTHEAYYIRRLNHFMGRRIRFCGWQNDECIRLFMRDKSKYQDRHVHADVIVDGTVGRLKNKLLHYTFRSFDQYMGKFDRYTTWSAQDRAKRTSRVRWHHLTARPAFRFFKQYVLKQGFRDGLPGLIVCGLAAFSVFLKYAKLWEFQQKKKACHE
ncbi:TPA: glycosyltransferase family 2 protein [Candidatus Sumerlaeota bacterium]|nr:glycosyltransferase family 2 protein [Candidatus Sumerlaeota bacterium]